MHRARQRDRVVKVLDLKSNGLRPRRFEPCRCRSFFVRGNIITLIIHYSELSTTECALELGTLLLDGRHFGRVVKAMAC